MSSKFLFGQYICKYPQYQSFVEYRFPQNKNLMMIFEQQCKISANYKFVQTFRGPINSSSKSILSQSLNPSAFVLILYLFDIHLSPSLKLRNSGCVGKSTWEGKSGVPKTCHVMLNFRCRGIAVSSATPGSPSHQYL